MKVKKINLNPLYNEEHFQFHTRFTTLVREHGSEILKISEPFENSYLPYSQKEDECLKLIIKSPFTKKLKEIDEKRDRIAYGIDLIIRANFNHPEPEVVDAAERLKILTDTYGDMSKKSYERETAAIYNLVKDLNGEYSQYASRLNLENWIAGLDSCNQQFEGLIKERDLESMAKTDQRMKAVREEIDSIYDSIIDRINALMIIEGEAAYALFAEEHNLHIEQYKTIIAQRKGRAQARREREDEEPIINYE